MCVGAKPRPNDEAHAISFLPTCAPTGLTCLHLRLLILMYFNSMFSHCTAIMALFCARCRLATFEWCWLMRWAEERCSSPFSAGSDYKLTSLLTHSDDRRRTTWLIGIARACYYRDINNLWNAPEYAAFRQNLYFKFSADSINPLPCLPVSR